MPAFFRSQFVGNHNLKSDFKDSDYAKINDKKLELELEKGHGNSSEHFPRKEWSSLRTKWNNYRDMKRKEKEMKRNEEIFKINSDLQFLQTIHNKAVGIRSETQNNAFLDDKIQRIIDLTEFLIEIINFKKKKLEDDPKAPKKTHSFAERMRNKWKMAKLLWSFYNDILEMQKLIQKQKNGERLESDQIDALEKYGYVFRG